MQFYTSKTQIISYVLQSISPGVVESELHDAGGFSDDLKQQLRQSAILKAEDIADAVIYVLSTPTRVQVYFKKTFK